MLAASLPRDALQAIAGQACAPQSFAAMRRTCKEWRDALAGEGTDQLWKAMALKRFRRLASIHRLSPAAAFAGLGWREHYRRQLDAENENKASWRPQLSDFILTIEVHFDSKLEIEWSGFPATCCIDGGVPNTHQTGGVIEPWTVSCRLWETEPAFLTRLLDDEDFYEQNLGGESRAGEPGLEAVSPALRRCTHQKSDSLTAAV